MRISYAIPVCNELEEIQKLIPFLLENRGLYDEIIVLYDNINGDEKVLEYICSHSGSVIVHGSDFNGHFADWKNELTSLCTGDYIFQIDADEIPHKTLMENIHQIIEMNDVDVILVPRVNTVVGLTQQHIQKWGWSVNENGWVNWPDPQWRIYRNVENIKWENKVHEKLTGYKTISNLPIIEELSLYHKKTIHRQEKQNEYYDTI
jgi:hypothetical protein